MNGSITAETGSVRLKPAQSHLFKVRFNSMEPCELLYELTGYGSGTIGKDGLYVAPEKPGSYEVRISCKNNPGISTYAYVMVSK